RCRAVPSRASPRRPRRRPGRPARPAPPPPADRPVRRRPDVTVDKARVERLTRELLEAIGEDPERPGLKQTPARMAELYAEFFAGVAEDAASPLAHTISVSRGPAPETLPSGAVLLRDIRFRSVCEHHLLPFAGHAHL